MGILDAGQAKVLYPWKRYWYPVKEEIRQPISDEGYLDEPDNMFRENPNIKYETIESLEDKKCLVLLGSQGLGKTTVLKQTLPSIKKSIEERGDLVVHHNLNLFGDETKLRHDIFENVDINSWKGGNKKLHLFLDSIDECHLEINNLSRILVKEFNILPIERLYLRLVCRTADWMVSLENELRGMWKKENFEIYELLPLQKENVKQAVQLSGICPEKFLIEIKEKMIGPLAAKPITLEFLINIYKKEGMFPDNQVELYEKGLEYLCEEQDVERRDAGHHGKFSPCQRLITAARLAYISIFANRSGIWNGIDNGNVAEEYFPISAVYGEEKINNEERFQVEELLIKETLTTGLFASMGGGIMRWAHKTFEEFLAAFYIREHELDLKQIISLISNNERIVPSLKGAAGWLAGMMPDFFDHIIKNEPSALLESDLFIKDSDREVIVDSLLRQFSTKQLIDTLHRLESYYSKLNHPNLACQLQKYIRNQDINDETRRAVINIASACKVQPLIYDLTDILFNPDCTHRVKVDAAYAIRRIVDENSKLQVDRLKSLAVGKGIEDPDDSLKGCALEVLWPRHLSIDELFSCLVMPKRVNFVGAYSVFITKLTKFTWGKDLDKALAWVRTHDTGISSLSILVNSILSQAFLKLDSESILENFVSTLVYCLKYRYMSDLREVVYPEQDDRGETWIDNDKKRYQVLESMISLSLDLEDGYDVLSILLYNRPLVFIRDIHWLIKCLKNASSLEKKRLWEDIFRELFRKASIDDLNIIVEMSHQEPIIEKLFYLEPIELNSPMAKNLKDAFYKNVKLKTEASGAEKINLLLQDFDSGDLSAWMKIVFTLNVKAESESDLTRAKIWDQLDEDVQLKIINAAEKFLINHHPEIKQWIENNTVTYIDLFGYHAFCLLRDKNPTVFATLPKDIWDKWAFILLEFRSFDFDNDREMVKKAYQYSPDKIRETLSISLDKIEKGELCSSILMGFYLCWDYELLGIVETFLKRKNLEIDFFNELLTITIEHKSEEGRKIAESLLSLPIPSEGDERKKAVYAASELMIYAPDAGWSIVWPILKDNQELGKEMISKALDGPEFIRHNIEKKLKEEQLGDFYIWLEKVFPTKQNLFQISGVLSIEHFVDEFKHKTLNYLTEKGTPNACKAIEKIQQAFPSMGQFESYLYYAQGITRQNTWQPHQIKNLLELIRRRSSRLVADDNQLLDIAIESLERLEKKLHDETPAIRDLWDKRDYNTWRPVDENEFSDYIKRHLDEDLNRKGIIINREVRISRGRKTDLHIDAINKNSHNDYSTKISLIIEVKGCWNNKLNTAMEEQLCEGYLKKNYCRNGIYLIGGFYCTEWDENDNRKKRTQIKVLSDAREKFTQQAEELSSKGYRIRAFVMDTSLKS